MGRSASGSNHREGPVENGSGWAGFRKIVALFPFAAPPVVR